MLGSDDVVAIDNVIQQYNYLEGSVGELLHRLKTRRALLAAVPRGGQYTTLQDNDERLAELELSNRGLRERLRTEQEASDRVEARLQAERDATRLAEEKLESLRRQLLQRTRIEQLEQGERPHRGGDPRNGAAAQARTRVDGHRQRCPVCKNLFATDEFKAHAPGCVDAIVRFSIMKAMSDAGSSGNGGASGGAPVRAVYGI
jgi:DNA repair exonuclease SbcCD ATPase subunit